MPATKKPVRDRAIMKNQSESAKADRVAMKEMTARQQNMTGFLPKLEKR